MSCTWDTLPGNYGAAPRVIDYHFLCHGAITYGLIYTLDLETAIAATGYMATTTAGPVDSATDAVRVVALETVSSAQATAGYRGKFRLQGPVEVVAVGAGIAKEVAVASDASGNAIAAITGDTVLGNSLAALGASATGTIWFYGAAMGESAIV